MKQYFIKYEPNGNNIPTVKTTYVADDKWSFVDAEESAFSTSQEAEDYFNDFLTNNSIIEINEEKYEAYLRNELAWDDTTSEFIITTFDNLPFVKQKKFALKQLITNIKEYGMYMILDDDLKNDIKRLRTAIKEATTSTEILTAITELQTILQDLQEG